MKVYFDPLLGKIRRDDYKSAVAYFLTNPATNLVVVANYSALPSASTVSGKFYWVSNSQGTSWLPGSLGGTYYNSGLYYSNSTTWEFLNVPYNATQATVDAGTNNNQFVTSSTLTNAAVITNKELSSNKNAISGYVGLTSFKINFKNALNTFTSFFTNANTAARTYTFPDKDITVAGLTDITGINSGTNTGDSATNTQYANDYRLANFIAGTNYLSPNGSAASLTNFPILNQNTAGNAATVTTNADLTGDITSTGNATTASAAIVKSVVLNTSGVLYTNPINFSTSAGVSTGNLSLISQTANMVLAGPTSGAATTPTFRVLVASDIPNIAESQVTNLVTDLAAKQSKQDYTNLFLLMGA